MPSVVAARAVAGALRPYRTVSSRSPSTSRRAARVVVASASASTLTLTRPDDWHLHVRDASKVPDVVPFTSKTFKRALVMPNLTPPVRTAEEAGKYRELISAAAPASDGFEPHMTLYLTDNTTPEQVEAAHASGFVRGYKLYPAGATTNS